MKNGLIPFLCAMACFFSGTLYGSHPGEGTVCDPVGTQNGLVIAVNFPENTSTSPSTSSLQATYFGATNSLSAYWDEASYGKTTVQGDVAGYYTLNLTGNDACSTGAIERAALEAAAVDFDLTLYNRIFISIKNPPQCDGRSWGAGCRTVRTPDGDIKASTSWNKSTAIQLLAHEGGHNLGLPHAQAEDFGVSNSLGALYETGTKSEYGDMFDAMGGYVSFVPAHYNAIYKERLGFIDSLDIQDVTADGSYTIEPLSVPRNGGKKALRILRGIAYNKSIFVGPELRKEYFWIETRKDIGFDASIDSKEAAAASAYGGAILHIQRENQSNSILIDTHPGTDASHRDSLDAPISPGESFYDSESGITLTHAGVDPITGNITMDITFDPAFVDTDADGIRDSLEISYGTDPLSNDTDGDGFLDYFEVCFDGDCSQYAPGLTDTDANLADTDGDGLNDHAEVTEHKTNPLDIDTDGDTLEDATEINVHGTDPNKTDTDDDGLDDAAELNTYGTNPTRVDTDNDGYGDGWEVANGTDPTVADSFLTFQSWDGTVSGRVITADGVGVAGITFWDVTRYPDTVTTDANGYFVLRGYNEGDAVYLNVYGTGSGYSLQASGWDGGSFVHSGEAELARNFIATPNADIATGRVVTPEGEGLAGITFWDVTKYPQTVTTLEDCSFVSQGYAAGDTIWFNVFATNSGYSLQPAGWDGQFTFHNGEALSGFDYIATQNPGTISGRITSPDGKPLANHTFWDVNKYPQTITTNADGRFIATGYTEGDLVWFNLYGSDSSLIFKPSGWDGQFFTHDGTAMKQFNYIGYEETPQFAPWKGTITGRVTTESGIGLGGITFWDVSRYPETVTTDPDGYFVIRDYLAGDNVWLNFYATNSGYNLQASGWSGGIFVHNGNARVALNFIATPESGSVSGRVRTANGDPLSDITFWDVTHYPDTITSRADGEFVSRGYLTGDYFWFNVFATNSGYTLQPDGWDGQFRQHTGMAMYGFDYLATPEPGTVSGRITTPDGKPLSGVTFWDVSRYPDTITTGADGRYLSRGYNAGDYVWFNVQGTGMPYRFAPANWNGQFFQHDGTAIQQKDFIAVPVIQ